MARKDELVEKVKREIGVWSWYPSGTFNTGYEGRWARSRESVSRRDFEQAFQEIKAFVEASGYQCSLQRALPERGARHDEWSIVLELGEASSPAFSFHVRVDD